MLFFPRLKRHQLLWTKDSISDASVTGRQKTQAAPKFMIPKATDGIPSIQIVALSNRQFHVHFYIVAEWFVG